jgi:hypothetical protein
MKSFLQADPVATAPGSDTASRVDLSTFRATSWRAIAGNVALERRPWVHRFIYKHSAPPEPECELLRRALDLSLNV